MMPLKLLILILVYMISPSLRQFLILILLNLPASFDTFDHLLLLGMISKLHSPLTFSYAPDISFRLWASFSLAHRPLNNGLTQDSVPKPHLFPLYTYFLIISFKDLNTASLLMTHKFHLHPGPPPSASNCYSASQHAYLIGISSIKCPNWTPILTLLPKPSTTVFLSEEQLHSFSCSGQKP